jgi:hypothetical protein
MRRVDVHIQPCCENILPLMCNCHANLTSKDYHGNPMNP